MENIEYGGKRHNQELVDLFNKPSNVKEIKRN